MVFAKQAHDRIKKILPIIIVFIVGVAVSISALFLHKYKTPLPALVNDNKQKITKTVPPGRPFFVAGWVPYWSKTKGADSLNDSLSFFDEIRPFAFGVNADGSLVDTLKIKDAPWPSLEAQAEKENVAIIPTVLWTDASAMHDVFSNKNLLNNHIDSIVRMLDDDNFSGVDIDYEGKDAADRDLSSTFLEALHNKLNVDRKTLDCTVEARTQDNPPADWSGVRAMAFANDFSALDKSCDSVTVMAYDQAFQTNGTKMSFEDPSEIPHAPNADNQWVEEVIQYALRKISPDKLVLGVPTYGWEFELNKLPGGGYHYERFQAVSYLKALQEAKVAGVTPVRDSGGELSFVFRFAGKEHIVTFSDAEAVREKISLAKKYGLKGISLFKLDGLADQKIFRIFSYPQIGS